MVFTKYSTDIDFHAPDPAFSLSCSHLQISADGTAHPPSPAFPWLFALSSDSIPNPQKCKSRHLNGAPLDKVRGVSLNGTFQRPLLASMEPTHPILPTTSWSLWPEALKSSRWGMGSRAQRRQTEEPRPLSAWDLGGSWGCDIQRTHT